MQKTQGPVNLEEVKTLEAQVKLAGGVLPPDARARGEKEAELVAALAKDPENAQAQAALGKLEAEGQAAEAKRTKQKLAAVTGSTDLVKEKLGALDQDKLADLLAVLAPEDVLRGLEVCAALRE